MIIVISSFVIYLNQLEQTQAKNEEKTVISYRTPQSASVFMADGQDGSETNPYIISTAQDMNALSEAVLNGNTFIGQVIVVASGISEINLGNVQPIGAINKPFSGTFDGSGVNFNLSIDKAANDYVGLFGIVQNGVIENLSVSGTITGKNRVGGIVGQQNVGSIIKKFIIKPTLKVKKRGVGMLGIITKETLTNTITGGESTEF